MTDDAPVEATTAQDAGLAARERLREMMNASPLDPGELMFNLGLYTRSSLLVKFLVERRIQRPTITV